MITLDLKYSVDKIKLEFQYIKTNRVQQFLDNIQYDINYKYYTSNNVTKCQHNFIFGEGEGTVYCGVVPNWKSENKHDKSIILEYNPNKVNPYLFDKLSWLLNVNKYCIKVMSFDIAVDMNVEYKYLRMLKRDKREYFGILGHGEVETRYLGALGNNHVKLYDKAKEQKLEGVAWSRFEITVKDINSMFCSLGEFKSVVKLPQLYYVNGQIGMEEMKLKDIDRIVLESIINDVQVLYTIKRYETRKRFEGLLAKFLSAIKLDVNLMFNTFYNYCHGVFCSDSLDNVDTNFLLSHNTI